MRKLNDYLEENRKNKAAVSKVIPFGEFYSNTKAIYYDVPASDKTYKIFAFISMPTTRKPKNGYPAVLIMHGGNGAAYYEITRQWADKGYVAIAPDFNGKCAETILKRDIDNPLGGPKGYGSYRDMHEKHPWGHFSVLSAMCAIDVLCAMSEVDCNKICSCGLSWGGHLNLMLLSQDKRIAAGSVIYSAAFTNDSERGDILQKDLSEEDKTNYIDCFEPNNYLADITCSVLFTAGTQDQAFKMDNRRKTAEGISGKAYFALRKEYYHGNFFGFEQPESAEFFNKILARRKIPQPKVQRLKNGAIRVKAFFENSNLQLLVTKGDVYKTERQKWHTMRVNDGETIKLLAEYRAMVLVEKTKGLIWSTNMILLD